MVRWQQIASIVLLCLSLASSGTHAQSDEALIILTEDNPPYSFVHRETGHISGTGTELVRELMRRAELQFSLTLLPWNRAFRAAQNNRNTCVFLANRTPDREQLFNWVGPLIEGGWAVYKRPDSEIVIQSPKDMKRYNVVGKSGSASVDDIEKAAGIKIMRTGQDETAARMLYYGRADLWVSGVIDGPLAAKSVDLPVPSLALLWKKADLSMACSKKTDINLIIKLNDINRSLDDLRKKVLARHSAITAPN